MNHYFRCESQWQGGVDGMGRVKTENLETSFSVPKAMNGRGAGTNPEELIVSAAASCFLMTLGIILHFQKIALDSLRMESEAELQTENGLRLTRITHRLHLRTEGDESTRQTILGAIQKAEASCLIAKAIGENVKITVEPDLELGGKNA